MTNRLMLYGLVRECPFSVACKDCTFQEIRELNDFEKQVELIDNMTVDKVNELFSWHYECSEKRENEIRTKSIEQTNICSKND